MIKIAAYSITLNCVEAKIPFQESIQNHLSFCDYVAVVDGGSSDGTWEILQKLAEHHSPRLIIEQASWNYDDPAMMGKQKTFARRLCPLECTHVIQTDMDELLPNHQWKSVRRLIRNHPDKILFDVGCINFHGGLKTTSVKKEHGWKWRISRNLPNIIHGVPYQFRQKDADGNPFFDRSLSDSCEYIWESGPDEGQLVPTFITWDKRLWQLHGMLSGDGPASEDIVAKNLYAEILSSMANSTELPCWHHFSWVNYERKILNDVFWKKQKRYSKDGVQTKGKFVPVDNDQEITARDVQRKCLQLLSEPLIALKIDNYPSEIIPWCRSLGVNQLKWSKYDKGA